ncbi:MAG: hypothetical protein R3B47_09175 [Bacteroidia bacterium]
MPGTHSPFEEFLELARKARKHYFNPQQEERISLLIKLIFISSLLACLVALLSGLPAHLEQGLDPEENQYDYLGLQAYLFVVMYFFAIQVSMSAFFVCISLLLGAIPIPYRWSYSMRTKHLMLWLMTIWSGVVVGLAIGWRLWWPDAWLPS